MDNPAVKVIFFLLGAFAFVVLCVYCYWPMLVFPMPGRLGFQGSVESEGYHGRS
jgi:hypothetical protein